MLKRVFPYHLKEMRPRAAAVAPGRKEAKREKRRVSQTIVIKNIERSTIVGKKTTYGNMIRLMDQMQAQIKRERERMAGVMAAALLDDQTAVKLGDYSDADLRRIMSILSMSGYIDECIKMLEAEKQAKHSQ